MACDDVRELFFPKEISKAVSIYNEVFLDDNDERLVMQSKEEDDKGRLLMHYERGVNRLALEEEMPKVVKRDEPWRLALLHRPCIY